MPEDTDLEAAQQVDLEVQLEALVSTLTSTLEVVPVDMGQALVVPVELEDLYSRVSPFPLEAPTLLLFQVVLRSQFLVLLFHRILTILGQFLSATLVLFTLECQFLFPEVLEDTDLQPEVLEDTDLQPEVLEDTDQELEVLVSILI